MGFLGKAFKTVKNFGGAAAKFVGHAVVTAARNPTVRSEFMRYVNDKAPGYGATAGHLAQAVGHLPVKSDNNVARGLQVAALFHR